MKIPKVVLLAQVAFFCTVVSPGQRSDCTESCDFGDLKPVRVYDVPLDAATRKVAPEYPAAARLVKAKGKIEVLIVVNRRGEVVRACTEAGHPLLRRSAEVAASKWKFKKNFGLASRFKSKFIQSSLTFTFSPDE